MKDKSNGSFQIDNRFPLFYFHFAEKYVTLGQGFYLKFFCFHVLGSQLFLPYIRIVCAGS